MSEVNLFNKYLQQIKLAYEQSDIKERGWQYSLTSTPLYKNAVVLCGFNWGVSKDHNPQNEYPSENFLDNKDLGSFGRIKIYLVKYLPPVYYRNIVQINLCFFRTENQNQISKKDLDLNVTIFRNLVKEIEPKIFIGFSAKITDALNNYLVTVTQKNVMNGKKTIELKKGNFNEEFGGGHFLYIPHPNYPLTANARKEAWEYGLNKTF